MILTIIICILLFLAFLPIKINSALYLNLLENKGAVYSALWFIPLIQDKFLIANGELTAKNNFEKEKTIQLNREDEDIIFIQIFINSYIRKIILEDIELFFDAGNKDNAFISTMIAGSLQALSSIFLNILKTKKYGFKSSVFCNPLYLKNKLTTAIFIACWTNLFDLIFTLVKSKFKQLKRSSHKD